MTQALSKLGLRVIFQGRYKGGTIHADNGDGKPICFNHNYWDSDRSTTRFESATQEVSCKHCRKHLTKLGQLSIKKLTLRERLFPDGR